MTLSGWIKGAYRTDMVARALRRRSISGGFRPTEFIRSRIHGWQMHMQDADAVNSAFGVHVGDRGTHDDAMMDVVVEKDIGRISRGAGVVFACPTLASLH